MNAGTYNLCIQQYATFARTFIWSAGGCCWTPSAGSTPNLVDLTGYTAALQIRAYPLATTIEYDASSDIVLGGTAGTIALTIPATATAGFTWWNGVYDLILTDSSGNVTRLLSGAVTVSPGVTP